MSRRSPLALAALATAAVPGLDVVATRSPQQTTLDFEVTGVLDSGGRHWVVRSPRHDAAGAALEAEAALLAALAPQARSGALPFAVPDPAGFAQLPEGGRAMVYRQLAGRPLDLSRLRPGPGLAADLGRCLAALHKLDPQIVEDTGLPSYDAEAYRRRCLAEVDAAARTGHVPATVLTRWERALEDVTLWRFRATPVHGDLTEEHVFVLDGEVSAVISFAAAHVGDPAQDLAWLLSSAPEDCIDAILEAYALGRPENADNHLTDRALLASELALARWLMHGVNTGNESIVTDAVQMLTDLADQIRGSDPIGHREPLVVPGPPQDWRPEQHATEHEADDAAQGDAGQEDATRGEEHAGTSDRTGRSTDEPGAEDTLPAPDDAADPTDPTASADKPAPVVDADTPAGPADLPHTEPSRDDGGQPTEPIPHVETSPETPAT